MRAWTKTIIHSLRTNVVFAVLCLAALAVVAWSRTDFSPRQTPLPISSKQQVNDFYTPLSASLESNVQEIAPAKLTTKSPQDTKKTIPSSVTVESSQPQAQKKSSSLSNPVQELTKTVANVLTPQNIISDDKDTLLVDDVTCTLDILRTVCLH
jgi:hypothetical protein